MVNQLVSSAGATFLVLSFFILALAIQLIADGTVSLLKELLLS